MDDLIVALRKVVVLKINDILRRELSYVYETTKGSAEDRLIKVISTHGVRWLSKWIEPDVMMHRDSMNDWTIAIRNRISWYQEDVSCGACQLYLYRSFFVRCISKGQHPSKTFVATGDYYIFPLAGGGAISGLEEISEDELEEIENVELR